MYSGRWAHQYFEGSGGTRRWPAQGPIQVSRTAVWKSLPMSCDLRWRCSIILGTPPCMCRDISQRNYTLTWTGAVDSQSSTGEQCVYEPPEIDFVLQWYVCDPRCNYTVRTCFYRFVRGFSTFSRTAAILSQQNQRPTGEMTRISIATNNPPFSYHV